MALALMFIGIMGMGALAAASVRSNIDAQETTQAMNLADRYVGALRTEAAGWTLAPWAPGTDFASGYMPLLSRATRADPATGAGWDELTGYVTGGPRAFTRDLVMVVPNDAAARFCVHYNLTWLQLDDSMRADVRVYWLRRSRVDALNLRGDCGTAQAAVLGANIQDLRAVRRSVVLTRSDVQ